MKLYRVLPPPAALLIGIVLLWLGVRLPPEFAAWSAMFDFPGRRVIGMAFFIVALALMIAAVAAMQRWQTTVNPLTPERSARLVTEGVFGFSRNPIYLGDALILVGAGFWFGTAWAVLVTGLFVVYIHKVQIRAEERALAARFGAEFQAYSARVRRWL